MKPKNSEQGGQEKGYVLVVHSSESVYTLTAKAFQHLGYKVATCVNGAEAVRFYRDHHQEVDMVIAEMVMPDMDGQTVLRELREINPEVRVLLAAGFDVDSLAKEAMVKDPLESLIKPSVEKAHLMVVDDDRLVREFSSRALRKLGYKVTACADGVEGVRFYRDHHQEIDMVIMDMIMPNMDGRAAFRELKKINPEVRVLLASGFAVESEAQECMREGALEFLTKPFTLEDLSRIIKLYVGR